MDGNFMLFRGYRIKNIHFDLQNELSGGSVELSQKLEITCEKANETDLPTTGYNSFLVTMKLGIEDSKGLLKISIIAEGVFEINKETDETNKCHLLEQNAPAILYPYIRALVSSITSQAGTGVTTLVLPVANFTSQVKREKDRHR